MLIPKYFLLLIFLFTPQMTQVFANMEKAEFMLMNLYEPYEHQFNSFKETLNSALNSFNHIVEKQLLSGDFNDQKQNQSSTNELTLLEIQENYQSRATTSKRLLKEKEGNCLNSGFTVNTASTLYLCDGQAVSKSVYEENAENGKTCSVEVTQKTLCYCPYDFYGAYCEKFNPINCVLEPISHPQKNCQSSNAQTYVSSYGQNDQPCYSLKRNTQLNMIFRAKCQSSNPQWNYEGIKTTEEIAYEPIVKENVFTYELDTENLKTSDLSIFSLQFKFVNWNRMFNPYVLETFLKPTQVIGSEDITFSINLDSKLEEYRLSGRYYYELLTKEPYLTSNRISGVLENSNFTEPRNKKKMKNIKYLLYIVLTCIIVGITFVVLKHKKLISWRRGSRKESYEPLIEMSDHSHAD